MALITFTHHGQTWQLDSHHVETWPDEVKALLGQGQREAGLCGFGDWQCPRLQVGYLCGGRPDKRYRFPYWVVLSRHPVERRPFPGQQLPLLPPTSGWIAAYHCARGAAWAEATERELGALRVTVQKLSKVKGKIKGMLVDFSDVLNLGCERGE